MTRDRGRDGGGGGGGGGRQLRLLALLAASAALSVLLYLRWTASGALLPAGPPRTPLDRQPLTSRPPDTLDGLLRRDFFTRDWETCDDSQQLAVFPNNDHWQHPFNTSFYALAAYPDRRLHAKGRVFSYVRIIAMRDGYEVHSGAPIHCQLRFENLTESVPAQVELVWQRRWDPQNAGMLFDPVLVSCPLREDEIPHSVALTPTPCAAADTDLPVDAAPLRRWQRGGRRRRGFAVCVKGLQLGEGWAGRLVEWIELLRLLGAEEFVFYRYDTAAEVTRVLEHYAAEGVATIVNVTLPGFQPNYPPERRRYLRMSVWQKRRAELVHYNDCLYRNLYRYRFVVPLDVDEVLVPLQYRTWTDLMAHLEEVNPRLLHRFASLSVRNVYFFNNLTQTPDQSLPEYHHILRHTQRSSNISGRGFSSKAFVSTRGALTVFNHYALSALYPFMAHEARVVPAQALLYHYRSECPADLSEECRDNYYRYTETDHSLGRFRDQLISRVSETMARLEQR